MIFLLVFGWNRASIDKHVLLLEFPVLFICSYVLLLFSFFFFNKIGFSLIFFWFVCGFFSPFFFFNVGIFHRDNRLFFELFCCVSVDLGGGLCSALSGTYEAKETQETHHYVCEVSSQSSFFFPSFRVFICFFVLWYPGFLGCKNEDWEEWHLCISVSQICFQNISVEWVCNLWEWKTVTNEIYLD